MPKISKAGGASIAGVTEPNSKPPAEPAEIAGRGDNTEGGPDSGAGPARPRDDAPRPEWVTYVEALGGTPGRRSRTQLATLATSLETSAPAEAEDPPGADDEDPPGDDPDAGDPAAEPF